MGRWAFIGFVTLSLVLHVAVSIGAIKVAGKAPDRKPTTVAVVSQEKKKPEEKKEKPKPPEPPPPPAPVPVVKKAAPQPTHEAAPPPPEPVASSTETHAAPAFETSLELSNTGPGLDIGPQEVKTPKPVEKPVEPTGPKEVVKKEPKAEHHDEEAPCLEEPTKPEPIQKTEIEYTEKARQDNIEGRLLLKLTIDKDGGVSGVEVVNSVEASLDAAAVASVKQWRFKPSTKCGKPFGGATYTLARRFELGD